mmetsp:Transcript_8728/g.12110  ORF Transcript_8728/g.12110 Transcript_8728/m.12110 type:complete len:437 (-) Transcript_8728:1755-3065(-)
MVLVDEDEMLLGDNDHVMLGNRRKKRRSLVIEGFKLAFGLVILFVLGTVVRRGVGKESITERSSTTRTYTIGQDEEWELYKQKFQKNYASEDEEVQRRENFHQRMRQLYALNKQNGGRQIFGATVHTDRALGEQAYARGHKRANQKNQKDQIDLDEWRTHRLHEDAHTLRKMAHVSENVVDWRAVPGALSPVKNQGQCGSCWSFSASEQIESQLMFATGDPMVELSPQQLASCVTTCYGCGGGDTTDAYEYLMHHIGLAPEAYWPYVQGMTPDDSCLDQTCTAQCDKPLTSLKQDFTFIGHYAVVDDYAFATQPCNELNSCNHQDLESLALALNEMPVSVCLNAANWDDYIGGVMSADACGGNGLQDMDHCVSAVGYNSSETGGYWIVRNSWSTDWGDDGYIYLEFNSNTCGIANEATVALVSPGTPAKPTPPSSQ